MSSKRKQRRQLDKPPTPSSRSGEQNAVSDTEGESQLEKFERELVWCIEQLQLGLETQNSSSKQAIEATKILKILLSAKAPMIKKRQAMRNAFGDYRKKMADMEKQSLLALKRSKVVPVQSLALQKSKFFKKSSFSTIDNSNSSSIEQADLNTNQSVDCVNYLDDQSDNKSSVSDLSSNFQFGFKIDCDQSASNGTDTCVSGNLTSLEKHTDESSVAFYKSDNSFRFGFALSE